jgi:hypothetical protein
MQFKCVRCNQIVDSLDRMPGEKCHCQHCKQVQIVPMPGGPRTLIEQKKKSWLKKLFGKK